MIVDRTTLDVAPVSDRLLTAVAGELTNETEQGAIAWSNELALHVIEVKTNGPTARLNRAVGNFQAAVTRINALLQAMERVPDADRRASVDEPGHAIRTCGHTTTTRSTPRTTASSAAADTAGRTCRACTSICRSPTMRSSAGCTPRFASCCRCCRRSPRARRISMVARPGLLDARIDAYARNQARVPPITGLIIPAAVRTHAQYQERILEPMYRAHRATRSGRHSAVRVVELARRDRALRSADDRNSFARHAGTTRARILRSRRWSLRSCSDCTRGRRRCSMRPMR